LLQVANDLEQEANDLDRKAAGRKDPRNQ